MENNGATGDIRVDEIMPELYQKWILLDFEECLYQPGEFKKLKQSQTSEKGKFPVIDQGENLINGYVEDKTLLYKGELPVIVFGDHTRRLKYINFPFAVGADGTKIFKPKQFLLEKFFYLF